MSEVGVVGRPAVKRRVRPTVIVEIEIASYPAARLADALVGVQVDLLVLDCPPKPLDENVVPPRAFAVHADPDVVLREHAGKRGHGSRRALAALGAISMTLV